MKQVVVGYVLTSGRLKVATCLHWVDWGLLHACIGLIEGCYMLPLGWLRVVTCLHWVDWGLLHACIGLIEGCYMLPLGWLRVVPCLHWVDRKSFNSQILILIISSNTTKLQYFPSGSWKPHKCCDSSGSPVQLEGRFHTQRGHLNSETRKSGNWYRNHNRFSAPQQVTGRLVAIA